MWQCVGNEARCDWAGRAVDLIGGPCGTDVGQCGLGVVRCRDGAAYCGEEFPPDAYDPTGNGCAFLSDVDCDGTIAECDEPPVVLVCCDYVASGPLRSNRYTCDYSILIGEATGILPYTSCP